MNEYEEYVDIDLRCDDAIEYARQLPNNYIDLYILDPPFGIGEDKFTGIKNTSRNVIPGYIAAPKDYLGFCRGWMEEVYRTLKHTGTAYVILGWSYQLADAMTAARDVGLYLLNHIIWHYNNGVVPTKKKFSSSHYHILRLGKRKDGQVFNVPEDEDVESFNFNIGIPELPDGRNGRPSTYDKMDTWTIPKDTSYKGLKNLNCLPDNLIRKIIQYSSHRGDLVCDLFMGNFTTAKVAIQEDRRVCGCELNPHSCEYWIPRILDRNY